MKRINPILGSLLAALPFLGKDTASAVLEATPSVKVDTRFKRGATKIKASPGRNLSGVVFTQKPGTRQRKRRRDARRMRGG